MQGQRHHIGLQAVDDGTGLLAGAAMGLLDLHILTSLGLPILGEGGIDGLIKLSRRVIGNVEDGRAGKHCAPHKERRTDTGAGRKDVSKSRQVNTPNY